MSGVQIFETVRKNYNPDLYKDLNWEGSFEDYLKLVQEDGATVTSTSGIERF